MDRRLTPANGRVAHSALRGSVAAEHYTDGIWRRVVTPLAEVLLSPDGYRDRQLLMGARVLVLEEAAGHAFAQCERDGHCGYIPAASLGEDAEATHWVSAPAAHLYPAQNIKKRQLATLSLGARLTIVADHGRFLETDTGAFIIARHTRSLNDPASDPVTVAEAFLGTPYLWGGNSRDGIDCAGLTQAAHLACGIPCRSDSDLQEESFGRPIGADDPLRRGDLIFWKGHVAMMVDGETMFHANGHYMAVTYERYDAAITRILAQGGGPVTARKRL
ncbi:dipeptidyl-peptidase 6 [mine drainage metagenome]|uniref:Dipeptidyl-peptidase 6 n=1 Tax=mine drainage metagenome TaxID=410659 RepID=A0A1J5PAT9_9ZZZZ